ncbi:MAG TPA: preprotein translocase subunit SecG [Bacillota bacterium]|jgi:preprotein translocase subunit SecG|nr:preprotein translocase subunit SecG [Bacillota bacterium]HOA34746.1 preprotein translocase subunit SecG [Bacillota bacterium]HOJ84411.1 preprotein translocase subunit SecG [Bacillota bacterium]HOL16603.1 preprotein translocase subunit SecG [Bacillota bacterium]HPZ11214.1 preprotein translocase subunit SecG [Bacillota bacterium]
MLLYVLIALYILICIGLIASVLLQSGRSASLGVIEGGAQSLFGKKKGLDEMLARVTTGLAIAFMLFTIVLTILR